jgi:hypothetical protein
MTSKHEASEANDPNFTAPVPTTQDVSQDEMLRPFIVALRAAGYRVSKPRTSKGPKPKAPKRKVGPTFVAEFADGTVTRMSTYTSLEKLDWDRGERLSIAAYQSRWRTHDVPPVISSYFEQDGVVLAQRNNEGVR